MALTTGLDPAATRRGKRRGALPCARSKPDTTRDPRLPPSGVPPRLLHA